jgi:hypothetical protein
MSKQLGFSYEDVRKVNPKLIMHSIVCIGANVTISARAVYGYERGAVKWVANRDLNPGCEQSFGLVHIPPGKIMILTMRPGPL